MSMFQIIYLKITRVLSLFKNGIVQWCISIIALYYVVSGTDIDMFCSVLSRYEIYSVIFLLSVAMLDPICMALRLYFILPFQINFKKTVMAVILCIGFNNIFPAKAGDVIKTVWLSRTMNKGVIAISSAIIWERFFDVLALALLSVTIFSFVRKDTISYLPVLCTIILICIFLFFRYYSNSFHGLYLRFFPEKLAKILCDLHVNLVDKPSLNWLLIAAVTTVVVWLCHFAGYLVAFLYVAHFSLTIGQIAMVFAVTSLGTAIPSSPGSLGIFEGGIVLGLSWFGVEHHQALGIALLLHAFYFLPATLGAIVIQLVCRVKGESVACAESRHS